MKGNKSQMWRQIIAAITVFFVFAGSVAVYPLEAMAAQKTNELAKYMDPESILDLLPKVNQFSPQVGNPDGPLFPSVPGFENNGVMAGSPLQVVKETVSPQPPASEKSNPPVNVATGYLELSEQDLHLPGIGFDFELKRTYSSSNQEQGPFGLGWDYNFDSKLQMYAGFDMGEFRPDGTTLSYDFVKDDPEAYVTSYDGDDKTNYELHKGHYEPAENGDELERISQFNYRVTTPKRGYDYLLRILCSVA